MRLDKYLKLSRIIKRRSVANEICDAGRVVANGRAAKASYNVSPGDVLAVTLGETTREFEVLSIDEPKTKEGASEMYRAL